jgi:hypothetical protein
MSDRKAILEQLFKASLEEDAAQLEYEIIEDLPTRSDKEKGEALAVWLNCKSRVCHWAARLREHYANKGP